MSMVQLFERDSFFEACDKRLLYVAFLKSSHSWFPMCSVTNADEEEKFDTLLVSPSYNIMDELSKTFSDQVPQIENRFIQYLVREEIENLLEMYGLGRIALALPEEDLHGCGCI